MGDVRPIDPPPVVFVHGVRTSRTMWRQQAAAVERYGGRALAIDLPGHGERIAETFTLDAAVRAVSDAVDAVGGRALVAGLSLGGYVAITHAARRPDQCAGLIAAGCSTVPAPLPLAAYRALAAAIHRLPDRGAWLNRTMVDLLLPEQGAHDVAAGGFALDGMADMFRAMRTARPLDDLAQVRCPVWLVNGQWDQFRTQERTFLRACRDGRLVVLRGANHLSSLSAPEAFTRVVLEAMDDVAARSSAGPGHSSAGRPRSSAGQADSSAGRPRSAGGRSSVGRGRSSPGQEAA